MGITAVPTRANFTAPPPPLTIPSVAPAHPTPSRPNHPLLQPPHPRNLGGVPFFAAIAVPDLSCETRKNSAEQLLAAILAADDADDAGDVGDAKANDAGTTGADDPAGRLSAVDDVDWDLDAAGDGGYDFGARGGDDAGIGGASVGLRATGGGMEGVGGGLESGGCGGGGSGGGDGCDGDGDDGGVGASSQRKRDSEINVRKSQTFFKLAGRLKNGEIYFYQRPLTRQLEKEERSSFIFVILASELVSASVCVCVCMWAYGRMGVYGAPSTPSPEGVGVGHKMASVTK